MKLAKRRKYQQKRPQRGGPTEAVEQMLELMRSAKPRQVNIKELINAGRR